jgi:hypothetical protein
VDPKSKGEEGERKDPKEEKQKDEKDKKGEKDEKDEKDKKDDYEGIPGFDREAFELDSDVLQVKDLAFDEGTLKLSVLVRTTNWDVLVEELRALAPAFDQALRAAEADGFDGEYDEFFEAVEEIKFTLYAESKTKLAAVYLNVRWLREYLFGDLTNNEFVERLLSQIEDA